MKQHPYQSLYKCFSTNTFMHNKVISSYYSKKKHFLHIKNPPYVQSLTPDFWHTKFFRICYRYQRACSSVSQKPYICFFYEWIEFPKETIQAWNSPCDTQTFKKGLDKSPVVHMSVYVYCCSYCVFRKKTLGRKKSKTQTIFPIFWNPLGSDKVEFEFRCTVILFVGFEFRCTVILTQETRVSPFPVEVTCAAGSSDGHATCTAIALHMWHAGGWWKGRSLNSTSSLPLYNWARAAATREALIQFS